jgi:hypothetical protein
MEMVVHQAIEMPDSPESLMGVSEDLQEEEAVIVGEVDRLLLVSPGIYMIERTGVGDSELSRH